MLELTENEERLMATAFNLYAETLFDRAKRGDMTRDDALDKIIRLRALAVKLNTMRSAD